METGAVLFFVNSRGMVVDTMEAAGEGELG